MTKIVLDAESFKALASDTRLQILKALDARPLTVSELSRLLDLNKATVFEHLKQLTVADLAKREDDPARKWVYYKLTWKGRNVLHPENAQIFIMLGMGALGVGGAVLQTARILQFYAGGTSQESSSEISADLQKAAPEHGSDQAPAAASASSSTQSGAASGGQGVQRDSLEQDAGAPPPAAEADSSNSALDSLTSPEMMIILAILSFLILLALLVRSLYVAQRRERRQMLDLIRQLPFDVNDAEEKGV